MCIRDSRSAVTLTASGYLEDLDAALPSIDELRESIRLRPKPMRTSIEAGGVYINHLYGFSINTRLDASGKAGKAQAEGFTDCTPDRLVGTRLGITPELKSGTMVVLALPTGAGTGHSSLDSRDFLMDELENLRAQNPTYRWSRPNPGPFECTFGGAQATRKRYGHRIDGMDLIALQRDRILFAAVLTGSELERDTMLRWFSILGR